MSDDDLRASVSRVMRGLNHDLKNPLGAADGYLDLMLSGFRGDITDEQRQTLERVRALIATGVAILEDVVEYTRAALGELNVRPSESDLRAVVRMTLDRHAARAQGAGVELRLDAPEQPVRVVTDPDLVDQIVDRLVANGLDHAPEGGSVEVALRGDGAGAMLRVSDSGPGVSDADRDRVFLAFERGDPPARQRESAGIGFGLALARALAERLGGTLELEQTRPTTFTARLPNLEA